MPSPPTGAATHPRSLSHKGRGEAPHPRPLSHKGRGEKSLTPGPSPTRGEGGNNHPQPLAQREKMAGIQLRFRSGWWGWERFRA